MKLEIASKIKQRIISAAHKAVSVGAVLTVVVASIALAIGLFLLANFQLVLNTSGLPSAAQTAIGQVFSTAYTAFQLLVVGLIVLAAVAILSILTGGFGMGGGAHGGKGAWLTIAPRMPAKLVTLGRAFAPKPIRGYGPK